MIDATPALRLAAARRVAALGRQDPVRAQVAMLRRLLRRAAATRFGREHGFDAITTVSAYQRAVELRNFDSFWAEYWGPSFPELRDVTWPGRVPFFALSSGTTSGSSKHIPVTRGMMRSNTGAGLDTLALHLAARPGSRVFGGRNGLLGGSTGLRRLAPGVQAGDLSGIAAARMPVWARARAFPPLNLAQIADWGEKMARMAPASLRADLRSISGTPSWLLMFFAQVASLRPGPRRLVELFPNLELVVHGGVGMAPYRDAMAGWLEGSRAETREVYPASEGFIAAADRGPGDGLRLILDRGLFFEFVPVEQLEDARPERHWIGTAELGREYALVLTSNAGLWSYVIGDVVRLVSLDPPRVVITGRTAQMLSAFGEHLTVGELDRAMTEAARAVGGHVVEYAAGAVFPGPGETSGGHVFVVELAGARAGFAARLDAALAQGNDDYAAHRSGMRAPVIEWARPGAFAAWMASRGRLGGQNKVPRVINDAALLASLRSFVRGH